MMKAVAHILADYEASSRLIWVGDDKRLACTSDNNSLQFRHVEASWSVGTSEGNKLCAAIVDFVVWSKWNGRTNEDAWYRFNVCSVWLTGWRTNATMGTRAVSAMTMTLAGGQWPTTKRCCCHHMGIGARMKVMMVIAGYILQLVHYLHGWPRLFVGITGGYGRVKAEVCLRNGRSVQA